VFIGYRLSRLCYMPIVWGEGAGHQEEGWKGVANTVRGT